MHRIQIKKQIGGSIMFKKVLSIILALVLVFGAFCIPAAALEATPTSSTVYVNGINVTFDAYLIEGNNYFKLRDLAYTLSGTVKQFNVGWNDAANAITLTSGQAYKIAGGEMMKSDGKVREAVPTSSTIYLDGAQLDFTVYNIGGNNFFKLRDLMSALNVGVTWDNATSTIGVDTSTEYETEELTTPTASKTEPAQSPTEPTKPSVDYDRKLNAAIRHFRVSMKVLEEYTNKGKPRSGFEGSESFSVAYHTNGTLNSYSDKIRLDF
jgi:hypothetical protein